MRIRLVDHVVLTVRDVDRNLSFHRRALAMSAVRFGEGHALGEQKLNLHQSGRKFEPRARVGLVAKTGARPLRSVYFRDPDGNVIEVANEVVP